MFFKVLDSLGLKPGFQSTQRMQAAHTTVLQCTQKLAILTAPIDIYIVCLKKHNTFLFLFFWSCEAFVSSFCVFCQFFLCAFSLCSLHHCYARSFLCACLHRVCCLLYFQALIARLETGACYTFKHWLQDWKLVLNKNLNIKWAKKWNWCVRH